jgi:hypothetical protein
MPIELAPARLALNELARLQDDVLTRRQLYDCGYTESAIRACVRVQRWRTYGRRVVVLHNGPLTTRQRWWVAVLAQHHAALAGITAATEYGLSGFRDDAIHLLLEFGARRHPVPGVHLHVSRRFAAADIHPGRVLPTVRIERALVDGASWTASERKACAVLAAGVQQGLTTAARLKPELAAATGAHHHRLLTRVLWDIEGGAQSFAEIDVGRCAARAGLPPPIRQAFRYDRAGRKRWLDVDFKGFSAEIDGAVHLKPLRYWDDMERQNDLVIVTGNPILRFSTVAFRIAREVVIAQLTAAARRFGC